MVAFVPGQLFWCARIITAQPSLQQLWYNPTAVFPNMGFVDPFNPQSFLRWCTKKLVHFGQMYVKPKVNPKDGLCKELHIALFGHRL